QLFGFLSERFTMPTFCMNAIFLALFLTISWVSTVEADCSKQESCRDKNKALHLKLGAIASILTAGSIGVCLPIAGRTISILRPDKDAFFAIKAFAAGVILATGFVHILPHAFESLGNACLEGAWQGFPFAGFVAMVAAVGSLLVDAVATGYYHRAHLKFGGTEISVAPVGDGEELENPGHIHKHGGAHGYDSSAEVSASSLIRHRVISQVLELGIVAHSAIIGISLGTSQSPCTIRPLVAALSFHQLFEGMGARRMHCS
ncbi:hypothetical protein KI387_024902, partial [Taxus chinensis]